MIGPADRTHDLLDEMLRWSRQLAAKRRLTIATTADDHDHVKAAIDDLDLADNLEVDVIASPAVPSGKIIVTDQDVLDRYLAEMIDQHVVRYVPDPLSGILPRPAPRRPTFPLLFP